MRALRRFFVRLAVFVTRRRNETRLRDEIEEHLGLQTAENIRAGMRPEEARRQAILKFGPIEAIKEDYRQNQSVPFIDSLIQDTRYTLRGLRKNLGFTAVVVLTLALGIGANTAVFSVVYAALLKPLPYPAAERLFSVEVAIPGQNQFSRMPVRIQDYLEWRRANTAFSAVAALTPADWNLTGNGEPERASGARVSSNFFLFLGVAPAMGRSFTSEEETAGRDLVVVISDGLWRRRYGSDPSVVGTSIDLNGQRHTVIGVAPPSLLVPIGRLLNPMLPFASRIDLWKPIAPTKQDLDGENWNYGLLVRLRDGESGERGRQQLQALLNTSIRRQVPDLTTELTTSLVSLREVYTGSIRVHLLLIFVASGLLLLVACINLMNLFLTRSASRATEFATRLALGAGKRRILSQALVETTVLCLVGGMAGVLVAHSTIGLLVARSPESLRLVAGSTLSSAALLFAFVATSLTSLACGYFAARRACQNDSALALRQVGRTTFDTGAAARFRRVLVGTEIAFGTALLASAGLLLHSFVNATNVDRGYEIERVLAMDLNLFGQRYTTGPLRLNFSRQLSESVRRLPGVLAAGAISNLPAMGQATTNQAVFYSFDTQQATIVGRPVADIRSVTPGYFAASGQAVIAGRFLTEEDQTPVAVISESLATRLWPGESIGAIVGRQVRHGDATAPLITIVGVVGDVRAGAAERTLLPQMYRPYHQRPSSTFVLVVKTANESDTFAAAIRNEIHQLDPLLPIGATRRMRQIMKESLAERHFQTLLTSLFAVLSVVLGTVGVYGVVSYSVTCRTRDIGLRMALGAMTRDVLRGILAMEMRPVFVGLILGLSGAILMARLLRGLLFSVDPLDPVSLVGVVLILLSTAGVACYIPARRAARVDPLVALRYE
jgi:putative ABC transport system permease protein